MKKLHGYAAIEAKYHDNSITLNKYDNTVVEGALLDITIDYAEDVAREDSNLIWCYITSEMEKWVRLLNVE